MTQPPYIFIKELQNEEAKLGMLHKICDDYLKQLAINRWSCKLFQLQINHLVYHFVKNNIFILLLLSL